MIWFEMNRGLCVSGVRSLYMEKQPGKQVMEPKSDSNDFARWCEMKYSYTWRMSSKPCLKEAQLTCDIVTTDCLALLIDVSPQLPMIFLSCIILFVSPSSDGVDSRRDQPVQGQLFNSRISIDHEEILVKARIDTDNILDQVVHLELERVHWGIKVYLLVSYLIFFCSDRIKHVPY